MVYKSHLLLFEKTSIVLRLLSSTVSCTMNNIIPQETSTIRDIGIIMDISWS